MELNLWYFTQWGQDAKDATIGHELGHVLGLGEVEWVADICMLMLSSEQKSYDYCGVVRPTSKDASSVP